MRHQSALEPDADEGVLDPDSEDSESIAAVQLGLWISATRCVLTYVLAPAAGALGLFLGPFGLVLQVLGAITATYGSCNLWSLGHRLRYVYAFVATAVTAGAVMALGQTLKGVLG